MKIKHAFWRSCANRAASSERFDAEPLAPSGVAPANNRCHQLVTPAGVLECSYG